MPPEEHHQHDDEEHEGQRVENVDDAHHDLVGPPADEARDRAIDHADQHRHQAADDADGERHPACHQGAGQQVAAARVGAEQEIVLLDRGRHDEPSSVGGSFHHLGVLECRGAVEIAGDPLVDRRRGDRDDDLALVLLPLLDRHPGAPHCVRERAPPWQAWDKA